MKLTLITSDTVNVVKQIGFNDGELVVNVPAMPAKGTAVRVTCSTLHDLADVIRSLDQKQAVVWGDYRKPENSVSVVRKGEEVNGSISRSKDFFFWPDGETIFAIDYDGDEKLAAEQLIEKLAEVFPEFALAGCVVVPSSSGGIMKDGEIVKDSTGMRLLYLVPDGTDIKRFSDALFELAWLTGFGSIKIASTGEPLRRCSLFDKAVHSPERFDFLAAPTLNDGLEQQREIRVIEGGLLDTRKLTDPTNGELLQAAKLTDEAKAFVRLDCQKQRRQYKGQRRAILIEKGIDEDDADQIVESCLAGTLLGSFWLEFDDGFECYVRDVLRDPRTFDGKTLPDPKEPDRGKNKARVFFNDPDVVIHSNLHGGQNFVLRYDCASLLEVVEQADKLPKTGKLFSLAEVDPTEQEQVLAALKDKFGVTMRALRQAVEQRVARPLTHQQMADRFVEEHGLMKFADGAIWKPDKKNIWQKFESAEVEKEVGQMFKDQTLARTQSQYSQVRRQIQNTLSEPQFFADAPFGLAGPSGFFTIDDDGRLKRELLTADHRQKFAVPFDANLKEPQPEKMLDFLHHSFKDTEAKMQIARFQEAGGATLTGIGAQQEKAFFLVGPGNSGKSTALRIIERFIPDDLVASPNPQRFNNEYSLAKMAGARMIIYAEMDKVTLGGTFKALTGRDTIEGRHPTERPFAFKNQAMVFGLANDFPQLVEVGPSMMRRIEVLFFPHSRIAAGLANKNEPNLDRHVVDNDAGDLVGWFLRGGARLSKQGHFSTSKLSEEKKVAWSAQSDPLAAFLNQEDGDTIKIGKKESVRRNSFHEYFETWCEEQNIRKTPSRIELVPMMEQQGFVSRKTNGIWHYDGVSLLTVEIESRNPY